MGHGPGQQFQRTSPLRTAQELKCHQLATAVLGDVLQVQGQDAEARFKQSTKQLFILEQDVCFSSLRQVLWSFPAQASLRRASDLHSVAKDCPDQQKRAQQPLPSNT